MERMFVADQVYDRFVARFVERTKAMRLGSGLEWQRHGVADLAGPAGHGHGARRGRGRQGSGCSPAGGRPDLGPYFYEPTILEGVTPDMTCFGTRRSAP